MSDDIFAQMERDHEEFLRRIENASEQEITGLVDASGSAGGKGNSDLWDLIIHLAAWRDSSGTIHREEMRVEIPVSEEELSRQMGAIKAYSLLGLRLRFADHPNGRKQASGSALPVTGLQDEELSQVAAELQKPVVISDPTLGDFTLDRSLDWFRGEATWAGKQIRLDLSAGKNHEADQCLQVAKTLWGDQSSWAAKVADYAVEQLLERKNDTWLDEGESPVTPESFKSRMALESITVYPDGEFEFWHDDGDLFWGHSIQVSGSLSEGLTDVDTPG